TEIGALISQEQLSRVEGYVELGQQEGATLAIGGTRPTDAALRDGYFLMPGVLTGVNNSMRVAQEEIFGPVVGVIPFRDEDDA
ncbi:MAG TPA: carnitine dehydratase, partial [Chloroflexi bacterium]|nr:carnitine dehydratase [Chloroflexota bacterium]